MDFDNAKENIQPLASGRDASILQATLRVDSHQELLAKRQEFEAAIRSYDGDDPLEPWYDYIYWIEQSFPSGGRESGLNEVLSKCLCQFRREKRYYQDRRMIRLYIKFIEGHKDPLECYQQLFNAGVGTMVADFYIAWAYRFDLAGNLTKAEEIFRHGLACRAEPIEDLKEAHQHFGFSVYQRTVLKGDDEVIENANRQMNERRLALTSLRTHRNKRTVGSIRTGAAVKSLVPGALPNYQANSSAASTSSHNVRVNVLSDENVDPNAVLKPPCEEIREEVDGPTKAAEVTLSIVDKARYQENEREPGPWNKAADKKHAPRLIRQDAVPSSTSCLSFTILEDDAVPVPLAAAADNGCEASRGPVLTAEELKGHTLNFNKPCKFPPGFVKRNRPQKEWSTPITLDTPNSDTRAFPQYNKCMLYGGENVEFQPEELCAYKLFKRRNTENRLTAECDKIWKVKENEIPRRRLYPTFANKNKPQTLGQLDEFYKPEKPDDCLFDFDRIYDENKQEEFQFEQLMTCWLTSNYNETVLLVRDMDETCCGQSNEPTHAPVLTTTRRRSVFNLRRSVAGRKSVLPPILEPEEIKTLPMEDCADVVSSTSKPLNENVSPPKQRSLSHDDDFLEKVKTETKENIAITPQFKIFEDSFSSQHKYEPKDCGKKEEFKTPALPPPSASSANPPETSLAVPFKIVVDPPASPKNKLSGPYFDAEETCSTQVFNIFLKQSAVSTPKPDKHPSGGLINKVPKFNENYESIRPDSSTKFATIQTASEPRGGPLSQKKFTMAMEAAATKPSDPKSIAPTVVSPSSSHSSPSLEKGDDLLSPQQETPSYTSPPVRQLSTILECSEHGTTQGTTGSAGAKTTINHLNEHENDGNSVSSADHRTKSEITNKFLVSKSSLVSLDKTKEDMSTVLAKSSSIKNNATSTTELGKEAGIQLQTSIQNQKTSPDHLSFLFDGDVNMEESKSKVNLPTTSIGDNFTHTSKNAEQSTGIDFNFCNTPMAHRHVKANTGAVPKFSIFQDNCTETFPEGIVAPSTAFAGSNFSRLVEREDTAPIINMPALRLQESVTKSVRFQDDKTETIPMMSVRLVDMQPPVSMREAASFSNFLHSPIKTIEMDAQTTSSKCLPDVTSKDNDSTEKLSNKMDKMQLNLSDSFELYLKSPPKVSKLLPLNPKPTEDSTPLASMAKRVCNIKTPVAMTQTGTATTKSNSIVKVLHRESFHLDFSVIEDSQPANMKSLRNQNDLSFIPETQDINIKSSTQQIAETFASGNDEGVHQLSFLDKTKDASYASLFKNDKVYRNSKQELDWDKKNESSQAKQHQTLSGSNSNDLKTEINTQSLHSNEVSMKTTMNASKLPASTNRNFSSLTPIKKPNSSRTAEGQLSMSIKSSTQQIAETFASRNDEHVHQLSFLDKTKDASYASFFKNDKVEGNSKQELDWDKRNQSPQSKQHQTLSGSNSNDLKTGISTQSLHSNEVSMKTTMNASKLLASTNRNLSLLTPIKKPNASRTAEGQLSMSKMEGASIFEMKTDTEMFYTNISMAKSSTLLMKPITPKPKSSVRLTQENMQEPSLHIKEEDDFDTINVSLASNSTLLPKATDSKSVMMSESSFHLKNKTSAKPDMSINKFELSTISKASFLSQKPDDKSIISQSRILTNDTVAEQYHHDDDEMSIYFKKTPKTPKIALHSWAITEGQNSLESGERLTPRRNNYVEAPIDLDQTQFTIQNICVEEHINPFNTDLINAFLEQIDFISFIKNIPTCMLLGHIPTLKTSSTLKICNNSFKIGKLIGEGAYGVVYCATEEKTGKKYALKQEKPPNHWEYCICLEVQSRLRNEHMLPAFMSVDYALIGNNLSVLASPFSSYGSLITVCNKIKKATSKTVDEYVVMVIACELLEIIDNLHAIDIIHADVKADNFLLMKHLSLRSKDKPSLQLIDFGVAIDMRQFRENQTFMYRHDDDFGNCVEMRENRPWTYQIDLYGLAGVIHVLLFGKYMDIERTPNTSIWMPKTRFPRYFNKTLWQDIFKALLNIPDCKSMPNLQRLRMALKREMTEKETSVERKINEFNLALDTCRSK